MRIFFASNKVKFYLGDVRDAQSVSRAMRDVDYVFHAAALKQVPSCEYFPYEAIQTNIVGAKNLIDLSIKNSVKKVIFLSTDKAVYPINAMGMTKALMEKLVLSYCMKNKSKTIFCITRYGNVMLSRGSVIPHFVNQIKNNINLTVTDPSMTRFLMSLKDSVDLVFYALKNGKNGDIYVQKSPSTTILTLAKSLIELFNSKSKIRIIGTRLGEKLHETLVSKEEMARSVQLKKFFKIPINNTRLQYYSYFNKGNINISKIKEFSSDNTKILNINETINLLKKLDLSKYYD